MGPIIRTLTLVAAVAATSALSMTGALAQNAAYPTKPIKLIIPYAPGGGTDAVAAVFSDKLAKKFGQPVVKENHAGSNSVIGTALLADAAPDGHTLLVVTGAIANNPFLYAKLPYKTPESFVPVSILTAYPFVLGIRSSLPFKNMQELVDYAKANPGKLTAGTPGRGAGAQLALGLLNKSAGIQIRDIPFKGAGDSLNNVAGGFVDMIFSGYETVRPFAESGKMKAFAHTGTGLLGSEKIPAIGDTIPGFEYQNWLALIAPAGTPAAITDKLSSTLKEIFAEQDTKDRLEGQNIMSIASNSAEARDYLTKEMATSKAIIESIGLKPE
jgi:tripartite-type tricarboxylate transporter receptor subunit TctC